MVLCRGEDASPGVRVRGSSNGVRLGRGPGLPHSEQRGEAGSGLRSGRGRHLTAAPAGQLAAYDVPVVWSSSAGEIGLGRFNWRISQSVVRRTNRCVSGYSCGRLHDLGGFDLVLCLAGVISVGPLLSGVCSFSVSYWMHFLVLSFGQWERG